MDSVQVAEIKNAINETIGALKHRILDVEQRLASRPTGPINGGTGASAQLSKILTENDDLKAFRAGRIPATSIPIPASALLSKAWVVGSDTTVAPDRLNMVATSPQRRLQVRDLFAQIPTTSNAIEFTRRTVFDNQAQVQWDSSPGSSEGARKAESSLTYELASVAVRTIAHWIPCSDQVLADAAQLARSINEDLAYGVNLATETGMISGSGANGELEGLLSAATAFAGGATNQTSLDTLAKAANQLAASDYECGAFVLHPTDWTNIMLLKDTAGRYVFTDPGQGQAPSLWGIRCVITPSMTQGQFIALDPARAGWVAIREEANIKLSDQHDDYFVRDLVALRAEIRIALVIQQAAAIIKGSLSYAG